MWNEYLLATLAALMLLYLPGYFSSRGLGLSKLLALNTAPALSVFAYATLPVVYSLLDIPCGIIRMLAPTLTVSLIISVYSRLFGHNTSGTARNELTLNQQDNIQLGAYSLPFDATLYISTLVIGVLVCVFLFSSSLSRPDAFYSRYDNETHLNCVQAFLDSGRWSSLHVSKHLASSNPLSTPSGTTDGSFYPAAWHDIVALVCLSSHSSVAVASNALVAVICAVVNPIGLLLFVRALLPGQRRALMLMPLLASASAAAPWVYPLSGPTLPNLLGMALMTPVLGLLVLATSAPWVRRHLASCASIGLMSFASLSLTHPNTIFTAYIFFAAFGTHLINDRLKEGENPGEAKPSRKRICAIASFWLALIAIWLICYQLPFFKGVLGYRRSEHSDIASALCALCLFSFNFTEVQPLLTIAFVTGIATCLRKRIWWILFPVSYFSFCFVACRIDWAFVKYWFAGMWYMSSYRFTSPVVTFALPLLCLGLDRLLEQGCDLAKKRPSFSHMPTKKLTAILLALFCVVNFFPFSRYDTQAKQGIETAFGHTKRRLQEIYGSGNDHVYSLEEIRFVDRVVDLIGNEALVLNYPNDGSMFAYGINHLNTFYRDRNFDGQTPQSDTIRLHLDEYASNQQVHDSVNDTNAAYVLLLDKDVSYEAGVWLPQFPEEDVKEWAGIARVGDDTPFELVLAEGDMRLYRIIDAS